MTCLKFACAVCVVLVLGSSQSLAAIPLIDPAHNNGSFELAGGQLNTTKIQVWDGVAVPDIDHWTEWTEMSTATGDSGVQAGGQATDGEMFAFVQPGNAVYNLTTWNAAEGDQFSFSWDYISRDWATHWVTLVYEDAGVILPVPGSQVDSAGVLGVLSGSYQIPSGSPAIGKPIGLGLGSEVDWPELDNFVLAVNPVPEPASILTGLVAATIVAAVARRRRSVV